MLFETAEHLKKENVFIKDIEELWDCSLGKQPIAKQIDCIIYDHDDFVIGCLEIKIRNFNRKAFDTLMISSKKILTGQNWSFFSHQPFILAVRLNDCDIYLEVDPHNTWPMRLGGMRYPRVSEDREPVFYIPLKEFKQITKRTT
tara:strand:- start:623 stop:1054 length:432 start_codon:yes stop_codon:yes gene_type:complete